MLTLKGKLRELRKIIKIKQQGINDMRDGTCNYNKEFEQRLIQEIKRLEIAINKLETNENIKAKEGF